MARAKSTDEKWNRIWQEKFEDPEYYKGLRGVTCRTSSQILAEYSEGVQSNVRTVREDIRHYGTVSQRNSTRSYRKHTINIFKSEN